MTEDARKEEHKKAKTEEEHEEIEERNVLEGIHEDLTLGDKYLSAGQVSMADFLINRAHAAYLTLSEAEVDPEKYADAGATLDHLTQELQRAQHVDLD